MSKVASLTPGLVVKKGQAMPAVLGATVPVPAAVDPAASPNTAGESAGAAGSRVVRKASPKKQASAPAVSEPVDAPAAYYKALTVKLDRGRYETLKRVGLQLDKKSQEIFVEALDAYLAKAG